MTPLKSLVLNRCMRVYIWLSRPAAAQIPISPKYTISPPPLHKDKNLKKELFNLLEKTYDLQKNFILGNGSPWAMDPNTPFIEN